MQPNKPVKLDVFVNTVYYVNKCILIHAFNINIEILIMWLNNL
jgi:hypothetical protein